MNAVIYARFSSHSQHETSIEGQLKECEKYCEENGYTVIERYIDRALSGKTDKRPSFLRMIHDSKSKQFQYVIVYTLDRFSRDRGDSVVYKRELKKNGVRVLSARENITDDPYGALLEGMLEAQAEFYSAELKQKVVRGMELNAEKCQSNGGVIPLGYKVGADKHFEVDPETAPIVKMIFEEYAKGRTVVSITEQLNSLGYKSSRGAAFNKNSLRNMLKNKKYIGVYTYNGHEVPGGMPRIISDELFYKVAERMEKNKKAPARARAKVEYLLTTKLFCGHCKEMMTGFSATGSKGKIYRYYACNGKTKRKCNKKSVNKEYIENLVLTECRKLLTDENIRKIAREVVVICESEKETSQLKWLEKQLAENERKHQNLMNSIMECDIESVRKSLYVEVPKIEAAHEELEKAIALEKKQQPSLSAQEIRFFLKSLQKGDANDIKYQKALIAIFVNAIYLYDDRITLIFNSGDMPVTINDILLSEIGKAGEENHLCKGKNGPPKESQANPTPTITMVGGVFVLVCPLELLMDK